MRTRGVSCAYLLCLCLLLGALPLTVQAQWHWLDKTGRPVFSDLPPPPGVSEAQIIKRPNTAQAEPANGSPPDKPASGAASAEKDRAPSPSSSALEAAVKNKKAAEELEKSRQNQAEQARVAAAKAENCTRAKRSLAVINSGSRLKTVNEQGESVFMDEDARLAEQARIESVIRSDCQ